MKSIILAAIAAVSLAACTADDRGDPIGSTRSGLEDAGPGSVCPRPDEGCPCDEGTDPVACHPDPIEEEDGTTICQSGTRYCRAGAWSGCESIRQYTVSAPGRAVGALIDGPYACNVCRPDCAIARDYPSATDLTPGNSTGVVYTPVPGGITLTPTGSSGAGWATDSDGDGVPDVADTYPMDATRTGVEGGFYHALPFGGAAASDPLNISTALQTADVYFLMDTTGSMGGELANLKSSLTTGTYIAGCPGGVIGAIRCTIPDAWFGVGQHDDYPVNPYGDSFSGDVVYSNFQDITSDVALVQTRVNALALHYGNDWPESQSQALYAVASGGALGPYLGARAGCPAGRWGHPCFRTGTIPIVILFTDAPFHNGPTASWNYGAFGGGGALPTTVAVAGNETWGSARATGDAATTWTGYTGNIAGMADNVSVAGCWGLGADAVYSFTVSAATTVTISLEGSSYDTVLGLFNSAMGLITCNDDWIGLQSYISIALAPGTYYAVIDGYGGSVGAYRLSIGNPASVMAVGGYPVTWAQTVAALNARDVKVITVETSGGDPSARNDAVALATATGSVDGAGAPYVFSISAAGTGLGTAVVDAVRNLANYSRMDVSAVAVDNPATAAVDERGFVDAITAVSYPAGRCTGIAGGTVFTQCLPGTTVNFQATFRNDIVMPTTVAQVFNFFIDVYGDGSYLLAHVPVRIVVPPDRPTYPPTGAYWRDYDSSLRCDFPSQRPDWSTLTWTASIPAGTAIRFELRTANTLAGLGSAAPVSFDVPPTTSPVDIGARLVAAGQVNNLPFLRVTSVLISSADRFSAPTLTGFEVSWVCITGE